MHLLYRIPLLGVHFLGATVLGLLLCLLRPFRASNSRLCAQLYAWPALWLIGLRVRHVGTGHFPSDRPCVVVANHQSNWDLVVVGSVVPPNTVSIGKKSLRWVPLFGQLYWLAGNVLIDRADRQRARQTLGRAADALTRDRTSIWVFPEGTRNRGRNMLPFKHGAFALAVDTGVPIVPVCCSAYLTHLSLRRWRNGCARIEVLPPIETADKSANDVPSLMAECRRRMQAVIDRPAVADAG
ncbi:MAG: 1-acylglycerol-3-phosphate O-acyltransferase [Pseudomonadota bacterium]